MASVLHLSSDDHRITYGTAWKLMPNSGVPYATTEGADLFFLFRGTGVRFYGRIGGSGGRVQFQLDVNNTIVPLNGTNVDDGPKLVWNADNLGDGDHQLWVVVNSLQQNGSVAVDYFEVENSSGNGFDLLWAGPNATNVPKEAIIVDCPSPDFVSSNPSKWFTLNSARNYGGSTACTTLRGSSLNFSFDGVAIWYYSDIQTNSSYTVSIDGSAFEILDGGNGSAGLAQQMVWSEADLTPGRHTVTLRKDDFNDGFTCLDFFRVLRANNTGESIVPLAVGLTFGLITLAIALLVASYLQRRRRRMSALLDTCASPPHHTPPAESSQSLGTPQESERHSQPTEPPTHGSNLSSGAPTAMAVPTTSIGIPESGMPPTHETDHLGLTFPVGGSSRSGEVVKVELVTPVEVIEILDSDEEKGDERPKATRWWCSTS